MNSHTINLNQAPFQRIKDGKKTIESRLLDDKRQMFAVGDELTFISRANGERLETRIVALHKYATFVELMATFPPSKFGHESSEDALTEIHTFYTPEEIARHGVVGIEFSQIHETQNIDI